MEQRTNLSEFKQSSFPLNLNTEYYLLGVLLVLLCFDKTVRKSIGGLFRGASVGKTSSETNNVGNGKKVYRYDTYENLPGPNHLPFIGAAHHLRGLRVVMKRLLEFSTEFGKLAKFNLFNERFVMLNNPESAHAILSSNDLSYFSKSPFVYDAALGDILGTGLITSKGEKWKSQRKILSPAFSYKSFQNYCKVFVKSSKKLCLDLENLFGSSIEGEALQINTLIHCCGLQIVTESVMGLDLYDDEDGLTFYKNIKRTKEVFATRVHKPWLLLDFLWKLHPMSREFDTVVHTLNRITRKIIERQKQIKNEANELKSLLPGNDDTEQQCGKTMIDEMLRVNMSDAEMLYEVNTMIFAGFETTSATVHYLMFLLALNPEHQELCREEVKAVLSDSMKCPNGELTYDGIYDLKHLERCVNETLRIFPPVFGFMRKLEKPLRLSDTLIIPSGVNVVVPPLGLHRNPLYFPEPEKFDPDRFLPENVKERLPSTFIPFSGGGRNCIGHKFAIMAIKAMAAEILQNFDIYTTDGYNDVALLPSIFLTPERDYNFILKKRLTK